MINLGGPLQVYRKDMLRMFTLIGSTSFGHRECGTIGQLGQLTTFWIGLIIRFGLKLMTQTNED